MNKKYTDTDTEIPTFGVILKANKKLITNRNELLLVCTSETNKFNQKRFG